MHTMLHFRVNRTRTEPQANENTPEHNCSASYLLAVVWAFDERHAMGAVKRRKLAAENGLEDIDTLSSLI